MTRETIEARARLGDVDALIKLLEHDIRSRGATATVTLEPLNSFLKSGDLPFWLEEVRQTDKELCW